MFCTLFRTSKNRKNIHAPLKIIDSCKISRQQNDVILVTGNLPFRQNCFKSKPFLQGILGVPLKPFENLGVVFRVTVELNKQEVVSTEMLISRELLEVLCKQGSFPRQQSFFEPIRPKRRSFRHYRSNHPQQDGAFQPFRSSNQQNLFQICPVHN